MRSVAGLAVLGAGLLAAQQAAPRTEGARDLFFAGAAPKDELPAIKKPAYAGSKAAGSKSAAGSGGRAAAQPAGSAMHLGLRYTLLLVKSRAGHGEPVDPARNFQKGDCVAIDLESNRSGYLYVLAKESGGDWTPLFPTPELADRDNRIDPGQVVRTPRESCFEIEDPPGAETIFVVLSRAPRDIYELSESIKPPKERGKAGEQTAQSASVPAPAVNEVVEQMTAEAGTRELPFREVVRPAAAPAPRKAAAKEPQHAVYVVNGAAQPGATLVTRIEIVHR